MNAEIRELERQKQDAEEMHWTQEAKKRQQKIDDILLAKGEHPFIND